MPSVTSRLYPQPGNANQRPRNAIIPGQQPFIPAGAPPKLSAGSAADPPSRRASPSPMPPSSNRAAMTTTYTTADLEQREAQYKALRSRLQDHAMPLLRQRQNELLGICEATEQAVRRQREEYLVEERAMEASVNHTRALIEETMQKVAAQRAKVAERHAAEADALRQLQQALEEHRAMQLTCTKLKENIVACDKEIGAVVESKEQAKARTRDLLLQRENRLSDVESLRMMAEIAEDQRRLAEKILEEKLDGVRDLRTKIDALQRAGAGKKKQ